MMGRNEQFLLAICNYIKINLLLWSLMCQANLNLQLFAVPNTEKEPEILHTVGCTLYFIYNASLGRAISGKIWGDFQVLRTCHEDLVVCSSIVEGSENWNLRKLDFCFSAGYRVLFEAHSTKSNIKETVWHFGKQFLWGVMCWNYFLTTRCRVGGVQWLPVVSTGCL